MSIKVMTLVWDGFPASGSELLAMLALADHSNIASRPSCGQVKYTHCKKIAVGCGSPDNARGISRNTARYAAFSILSTSFGGSDGMAKAMPGTLRVQPAFHTHSSCRPHVEVDRQLFYAQLEPFMANSSGASRQSVSVRQKFVDGFSVHDGLPKLFFVLANALCKHLKPTFDPDNHHKHTLSTQIHGVVSASNVNQWDNRDWTNAANYIRVKLGCEPFELEGLSSPTLKRIKPPKAKPTYKPIPSTAGVVYVLRNKSMPGLLKIGFSKTSAEIRARSLSSGTNIPSPFEIVATFLSDDARQDESRVHQLLADHRVPGREFFQSSEADAISACEQVIGGAL